MAPPRSQDLGERRLAVLLVIPPNCLRGKSKATGGSSRSRGGGRSVKRPSGARKRLFGALRDGAVSAYGRLSDRNQLIMPRVRVHVSMRTAAYSAGGRQLEENQGSGLGLS